MRPWLLAFLLVAGAVEAAVTGGEAFRDTFADAWAASDARGRTWPGHCDVAPNPNGRFNYRAAPRVIESPKPQ